MSQQLLILDALINVLKRRISFYYQMIEIAEFPNDCYFIQKDAIDKVNILRRKRARLLGFIQEE